MSIFQGPFKTKASYKLAVTFGCLVLLSGCGRSTGMNQTNALPTLQQNAGSTTYAANPNQATSPQYAYPTPQLQNNASAQASAGGRAVATPNGYVYEQSPLANSTAYNFYNSQNPCLYPKPGQSTSGCGSNGAYYAPQAGSTGYPQTPNPAYPQSYSQVQPTYNPSTPNAYATGGTQAYPQSYPTAQTVANPYGSNTVTQQSIPQQVPTQSTADKARSRIDTRPASSSTSSKKSLNF